MKQLILIILFYFIILSILDAQELKIKIKKDEVQLKIIDTEIPQASSLKIFKRTSLKDNWGLTTLKLPSNKRKQELRTILISKLDNRELIPFLDINNENASDIIKFIRHKFIIENESYAEYCNAYYIDSIKNEGDSIQYKIEYFINTKKIVLISPIKSTYKTDIIASPFDVSIKQNDSSIVIHWKNNDHNIYALNIYRKSTNEDTFKLLNTAPILYYNKEIDSFIDNSTKANDTYTYMLKNIDYFNIEGYPSLKTTIKTKAKCEQIIINSLELTTNQNSISIQWLMNETPNYLNTKIYRSKGNELTFDEIATLNNSKTKNEYIDKNLSPGDYTYKILTNTKCGRSFTSSLYTRTIYDVEPPLPPTLLKADTDSNCINLHWENSISKDSKGYLVYRNIIDDTNSYNLLTAKAIIRSYYKDKIPSNTKNKICYRIKSIDKAYNKSNFSTPICANIKYKSTLQPPIIKSIQNLDGRTRIEWNYTTDTGTFSVQIYRFVINDSISATKINILPINKAISYYYDDWTKENVRYGYYLISESNANSTSNASDTLYFMREKTYSPQKDQEVNVLKIKKRGESVYIDWGNKGLEIQTYVVFRKIDNQGYKPITGAINTNSYKDSGILKSGNYAYKVYGYTKEGYEILSNEKEIRIDR